MQVIFIDGYDTVVRKSDDLAALPRVNDIVTVDDVDMFVKKVVWDFENNSVNVMLSERSSSIEAPITEEFNSKIEFNKILRLLDKLMNESKVTRHELANLKNRINMQAQSQKK